ncbi:MAG: calcium-binding protein [Pseudomonadota bacterium]
MPAGNAALGVVIPPDRFASGAVERAFFGANFLAGRDALNGSFAQKAAALGVSHLRWPGGGIAEKHFDLRDPNALPAARNGSDTTLTGYLAFCAEQGMRPVVVLPTKRFGSDVAAARAELEGFLRKLAEGRYGPTDGLLLEIGNEYYSTASPYAPLQAADYAALARAYTDAIARLLPSAETAVQIGRTAKDNATILAAFEDTVAAAAIDALVFHEYPWRLDPIETRLAGKMALAQDWVQRGVEADVYMSEWNVGSNPDDGLDHRHDYGHAQLSTMLEIAAQAIAQGVDMAAVWALQQVNKTALAADEGRARIFAAGALFALMQESMTGKRIVDFDDAALAAHGVHIHGFSDGNEMSLFIAARDLAADEITLTLDLPGLDAVLGLAWGERLTPLGDPLDYRPEARRASFLQPLDGSDGVTLRLTADYQIVRLDFALGSAQQPGRTVLGDDDNNILRSALGSDRLFGALGDDLLSGGAGHDRLLGGAGNDRLVGGSGRDVLNGQAGHDVLAGGSGSDLLFGQAGNDRLVGGDAADRLFGDAGHDVLYGQSGDDSLTGGAGLDRLIGGAGRDVFFFSHDMDLDIVLDFQTGLDRLHVRGLEIADFETLQTAHLSQRPAGALILAEDGLILLRDVIADALRADDFIF